MAETVTLLICTSGRALKLSRCLEAIASGAELPDQVVIVNGADPETPRVVESFASRFSELILIVHPNRNLATLRNLGLPHCTGDIIAMTDDDAIPDADWVEQLKRAHVAAPNAGAVGGPVRGTDSRFLSRIADIVVFPTPRSGQPIETLPTVNMSYKKPAISAVGLFDSTLFRGEDVDYNWRLRQAGFTIEFAPAIRVQHEHRATLRGLYKQQWMYGRAYVLVRRKWPQMYSVFPRSLRSSRSVLKLVYSVIAIFIHPWQAARRMETASERVRAYAVIVGHHLVWKLGMIRQILSPSGSAAEPSVEEPRVSRWLDGRMQPAPA